MLKKFALFYILFFFSFSSFAQKEIEILDKDTKNPVENVLVTNKKSEWSGLSDHRGKITIPAFSPGDTIYFLLYGFNGIQKVYGEIGEVIYLEERVLFLDEFLISANKFPEKRNDVPNQVEVINRKEIRFRESSTSADLLESSGKVMVQKSQFGGGSPIIRGFEANRVLIVVDGVRMNNAIYRSGHLQNVITIDPYFLEHTEILFGPGSVVYGSDALGGVMNFSTLSPSLSLMDETKVKGSVFGRYGTAANEKTGGLWLNIGKKRFGSLTAFSLSAFDDLRTGSVRNPFYGDWGKRFYYAERINGKDSMVVNPDPDVQKFTGYTQYNILQKFKYLVSPDIELLANFQYSTSTDIPRYDQLTEYSGNKLKFAEWYYGPQKRLFSALQAKFRSGGKAFDDAFISLAFQEIQEMRVDRRFGSDKRFEQVEDVKVFNINTDLSKKAGKKHELKYGAEAVMNIVNSEAQVVDIENSSVGNAQTRYPDGGSTMNTFGVYLADKYSPVKKVILSAGLRYDRIILESAFEDTSFFKLPFSDITLNTGAFSGRAGVTINPVEGWQLNLLASTGFRSPNIDDFGKVRAKDDYIIIPDNKLRPEYAYNLEFSSLKSFNNVVDMEVTVFYTLLENAIVRENSTLNGKDSINFESEKYKVQTNQNINSATIYGGSFELLIRFNKELKLRTFLNYTVGWEKETDEPMAHIPPLFGKTSLVWNHRKIKSEFWVNYNGWKHPSTYSMTGEDNFDKATVYGTPSWYTLNLRMSWDVTSSIYLRGAVENILDLHYRPFASGVSAPGRNFIFSVGSRF